MTDRRAGRLRPVGTPGIQERLLQTVIDLSAVVGFHGIAVSDLCELCRISRRTFYNYFAGVPELFLEAYVQTDAELRRAVWDAWEGADHDPGAVIRALVAFACADPVRADALFVQSLAAGDQVAEQRLWTVEWCGSLLACSLDDEVPTGKPGRLSLPYELACGGAWAVIRAWVSAGEIDGLSRSVDHLTAAAAKCTGRTASRHRSVLPAAA